MSKKDFWDGYVPEPVKPYRQLQDNGSKYFGESWDKAEQPAQQEPVACVHKTYSVDAATGKGNCLACGAEGEMRFIVDTTPQPAQRTWVGLTDDDIDGIYQGAGKNDLKRAREVIAAFKERNT